MVLKIRESGSSVEMAEILAFEKFSGVNLPKDYCGFLLKNNGGRPHPRFFPIIGFGGNSFGQVQDFFGIGDSFVSCDLSWNLTSYRKNLGLDFLPIACEDGGNLICICVAEPLKGWVVYWDVSVERPGINRGIYKIAKSFDGFLDLLQDIDPLAGVSG